MCVGGGGGGWGWGCGEDEDGKRDGEPNKWRDGQEVRTATDREIYRRSILMDPKPNFFSDNLRKGSGDERSILI